MSELSRFLRTYVFPDMPPEGHELPPAVRHPLPPVVTAPVPVRTDLCVICREPVLPSDTYVSRTDATGQLHLRCFKGESE